jgi:hypothetical protein
MRNKSVAKVYHSNSRLKYNTEEEKAELYLYLAGPFGHRNLSKQTDRCIKAKEVLYAFNYPYGGSICL